jgi:hypothetical protein
VHDFTAHFRLSVSVSVLQVCGAMITELDHGVGDVVAALKDVGMWSNTVMILVSGTTSCVAMQISADGVLPCVAMQR